MFLFRCERGKVAGGRELAALVYFPQETNRLTRFVLIGLADPPSALCAWEWFYKNGDSKGDIAGIPKGTSPYHDVVWESQ